MIFLFPVGFLCGSNSNSHENLKLVKVDRTGETTFAHLFESTGSCKYLGMFLVGRLDILNPSGIQGLKGSLRLMKGRERLLDWQIRLVKGSIRPLKGKYG